MDAQECLGISPGDVNQGKVIAVGGLNEDLDTPAEREIRPSQLLFALSQPSFLLRIYPLKLNQEAIQNKQHKLASPG